MWWKDSAQLVSFVLNLPRVFPTPDLHRVWLGRRWREPALHLGASLWESFSWWRMKWFKLMRRLFRARVFTHMQLALTSVGAGAANPPDLSCLLWKHCRAFVFLPIRRAGGGFLLTSPWAYSSEREPREGICVNFSFSLFSFGHFSGQVQFVGLPVFVGS